MGWMLSGEGGIISKVVRGIEQGDLEVKIDKLRVLELKQAV